MAQGSTDVKDMWGDLSTPSQEGGKVRASAVVLHKGDGANANLKEALGRLVVFGIYSNDPMATLSPMMWLIIPLLRAAGRGDEYKDKIEKWRTARNTAMRKWNTRNAMWKESKIEAEDLMAEIIEVGIRENLIIIHKDMWDIADLAARAGGSPPMGDEGMGGSS
jgi:hypothetical protein